MKVKLISVFTLVIVLVCNKGWSQIAVDSSKIIRVLSFNILHGATTKQDFDLDAIAKVIIDANPDFVALQEVDFKTNRALKYDLITELGWRTKMAPLFARAMPYDGGEYGEGVLSKYSFLMTRNVALPYTVGNEPRAAIEIITVLPAGDTIAFIGTHLDHLQDETDRVAQAKTLNSVFSSNRYPTILAGDLNALPGSTPINILEEMWTGAYDKNNPQPTFPSNKPTRKIDYVMFYPPNKWQVLAREVMQDTIASDHCAYLVILALIQN
jgi:endonuclease/exonuclease/phosphatase family metal-dependent hydrolase